MDKSNLFALYQTMKVLFLGLPKNYHSQIQEQIPDSYCTESATEIPEEYYSTIEVISLFITTQVDLNFVNRFPRLQCILNRSTGYDHIDLETCKSKGISLYTSPDYSTTAVAEFTIMLMLVVLRKLQSILRYSTEQKGKEISEKTIGIIGLGAIGSAVATICKNGFDARVIAYDPHKTESNIAELHPLEYVLEQSDIITLHIPLNNNTLNLLNKDNLKHVKTGSILINTSRGAVVETDALVDLLESGHIAGAGLDVVAGDWSELARLHGMDTVIITPHTAYDTEEALIKTIAITISNYQAYLNKNNTNEVV